jgi:uncharacterized protein YbaP (TraB family)
MVTLLIAAALAKLSVPLSTAIEPPLPDADPAIWVVNDEDTIIYLFGTFHALDGKAQWFNDEVMTAFVESDELVLETIIPDSVGNHGDTAAPAARRRQATRIPVGPSASFLASTRMAISAGRTQGMQVEKGADAVLRKAAEAAGKPVDGLESFEQQVTMLERMPASAPTSPVQTLSAMQTLPKVMSWMQSAWNRGDQGAFDMMVEQLRWTSPHTYRTMFSERNANWAAWIAERLQKPGTVFVAVGAGHLAGSDSVQAKLAERHIRTERIN